MDRRQMQFYFAGSTLLVLTVFLGCSGLIGYLVGPLSAGKGDSETNNVALVFGLVARGTVLLIGVGMIASGLLSGQRSDDPLWSKVSKLVFRAVLVVVGAVVVLFTVVRPFEYRSKDTVLILAPPDIERELEVTRAKLKDNEREQEATQTKLKEIEREQEATRNDITRLNADADAVEITRSESIKVAVLGNIACNGGSLGLAVVPLADHRLHELSERRKNSKAHLRGLEQDLSGSERRLHELSETRWRLEAHHLKLEQDLALSKRHYGVR